MLLSQWRWWLFFSHARLVLPASWKSARAHLFHSLGQGQSTVVRSVPQFCFAPFRVWTSVPWVSPIARSFCPVLFSPFSDVEECAVDIRLSPVSFCPTVPFHPFQMWKGVPGVLAHRPFILSHSVLTVSDIDECALGLHDCPAHSQCFNRPGMYLSLIHI